MYDWVLGIKDRNEPLLNVGETIQQLIESTEGVNYSTQLTSSNISLKSLSETWCL